MNVKHIPNTARCAVLALVLASASVSHAQIPVTDIASITTSITQQVESIAKWTAQYGQMAQQIQQYGQQIQQYKQQYDSMTGARGMASLLNNSSLKAALPADWSKIMTDVRKTAKFATERKRFPTSTLGKTNDVFDLIAGQNAVMGDLYDKAKDQIQLISDLTSEIDLAYDPAAKQDLANRIAAELNSIQANQNLANLLQTRQKQDLDIAAAAAAQELTCYEFKRTPC